MATSHIQQPAPPASRNDFEIAIICALPEERVTVEAVMTRDYKDEGQRYGVAERDDNVYTTGEIGGKPVVLVSPRGMGAINTRHAARGLQMSFPKVSWVFVVGIAGGAPFKPDGRGWKQSDIHLGDVIVSTQVIEYDFGRQFENGFERRTDVESVLPRATTKVANLVNLFRGEGGKAFQRVLRKTNAELTQLNELRTEEGGYHGHPGPDKDHVYNSGYRHKHQNPEECIKCSQCTEWYHEVCDEALKASCKELGCKPCRSNPMRDAKIHFGRYASGNVLTKSGHRRDLLIRKEGVVGFDLEGAGAWEVFGTIMVKGVIDYADSHENKKWRGYSAARAALCAAAMVEEIELPDRPHAELHGGPATETRSSVEQPWLLPRPANPRYVGYTSVLEGLGNCLLWQDDTASGRGQGVCVLSGLGGVGKSETILHFLGKNDVAIAERFWAVFWVDCGSEATAQADFERIGRKCGWLFAGGEALVGVKDRLVSSKRPVLLILDNCDDVRTDYYRYIPYGRGVCVILTTRLSDAKKYASVDPQDAKRRLFFTLSGLDAESALHFLLDASDIQERSQQITDQARRIVAQLDCHPLAITIASSLIRSAIYSIEEYDNALQDRRAQKELLITEYEQARYRSVSTTFEVSAKALQSLASTDETAKAALALLDILGFMHHQDVSEEMFVRAWKFEETVLSRFGDGSTDEDSDDTHLSAWHVTQSRSVFPHLPPDERLRLFRRARAHLELLSIVSVDRVTKCMSLNLMVHAWARERVSRPRELCTAVASILALSAEGHQTSRSFTPELLLHYEANFAFWKARDGSLTNPWDVSTIWHAYTCQMHGAKSIATSKICFQLQKQTRELSHDHLEQSTSTGAEHLEGISRVDNGKYAEAAKTLNRVVKA